MKLLREKLRVVTFLTRNQIDFLDKLSKDALFYLGARLSRVQILSELVDFLMSLGIDIKDMDLKQNGLREGILKITNGQKENDKQTF